MKTRQKKSGSRLCFFLVVTVLRSESILATSCRSIQSQGGFRRERIIVDETTGTAQCLKQPKYSRSRPTLCSDSTGEPSPLKKMAATCWFARFSVMVYGRGVILIQLENIACTCRSKSIRQSNHRPYVHIPKFHAYLRHNDSYRSDNLRAKFNVLSSPCSEGVRCQARYCA